MRLLSLRRAIDLSLKLNRHFVLRKAIAVWTELCTLATDDPASLINSTNTIASLNKEFGAIPSDAALHACHEAYTAELARCIDDLDAISAAGIREGQLVGSSSAYSAV